jgi:hypothetical protein
MNIPDVSDFDAAVAARALLISGFTAVDDVSESLYKKVREELIEELGFSADDIDIQTERIDTDIGPVFVFRGPSRVTLPAVRTQIRDGRSLQK